MAIMLHACSITWSISNLDLSPLRPGKSIWSPSFRMLSLGNTKWRLIFYPKGKLNSEYMSLFLKREIDGSELKEIVMDFKLSMKSFDTPFCFMKISRNVCFSENEIVGYSDFVRWDSTNVVGRIRPFGTFLIFCEMSPSDKISNDFRWNQRMDFKILSQDLTRLYESGKHHDMVLFSGQTEFPVHRAVLASRLPRFMEFLSQKGSFEFCARMDLSFIPSPILQTLLFFIYSGKLDIPMSAVTPELKDIAFRYEINDLLNRLQTFPKVFYASTVLLFEHRYIPWEVKVLSTFDSDFLRFRRVIKCDQVYCDKLVIFCQIVHDTVRANGDYINLSFQLTGIEPDYPVSMSCTVHFINTMTPLQSTELHAGYHVFESGDEWHLSFSMDGVHLEVGEFIKMAFEINLSDGNNTNFLQEEDVTTPDLCAIGIDDFCNLSRPLHYLQTSNAFTDFVIACMDEVYYVHKAILSARSPVFEKMLEHDMVEKRNSSVVINDIRPEIVRLMLTYMYSGLLETAICEDVCDLYAAADKYAILILKERCHYTLSENLNAQNVERVLHLAELHVDKRLICAAKTYILSNCLESDLSNSSEDVFYA